MVTINHCEDKVTVLPQAVAAVTAKTSFYLNHPRLSGPDPIHIAEANSLLNVDFGDKVSKEKITVDTISIDDFVATNNLKPAFIKIDVEGAETDVLKGAARTLLNDRPCGIVSVHNFAFRNKEESLSGIWQLLQQYRLIVIRDKEEMNREEFLSMITEQIFDFQFRPRP
jgi:FkbM family methyltransferase